MSYEEKIKELMDDAERAIKSEAWTSTAISYDSAIEGMHRYLIKQAYGVDVGYNWRKIQGELERKGFKIEDALKKLMLGFAEL